MQLWVTGAEGMLGSTVRQRCMRRGVRCVATARAEADLTDLSALCAQARAICPTHIIHCAAYTDVDRAEREPKLAFAANVQGTENIARVAQEWGAKLVHISTDYVFNGQGTQPYTEESPCAPINTYGISKWEAEKRVLVLLPQACVIRTSWLFGLKGKNFISSLVQWLKEKEVLRIVCDQRGRPTYCGDLAEAILEMLDQEGIFHFANAGDVSRYEIALEIFRTAEAQGIPFKCQRIEPVQSALFSTPAKRPLYSVLDTEKIRQVLGKAPRPWTEALTEYLHEISL